MAAYRHIIYNIFYVVYISSMFDYSIDFLLVSSNSKNINNPIYRIDTEIYEINWLIQEQLCLQGFIN